MNTAIRQWSGKSERYFKVKELTDTIDVVRMAASLKPPMATTIAYMLLVDTWDPTFCSLVPQLATAGRAPTPRAAPLEEAACHHFEASGVSEATSFLTTPAVGGVAVLTTPLAPVPPQRSQDELMNAPQAEIDKLLAADKTTNAAASRARRIDARRRQSSAPGTSAREFAGRSRAGPRAAPSLRKKGEPRSSSAAKSGASNGDLAVQRDDGTSRAADALTLSQVTAAPPRSEEVVGASEPGQDESGSVGAPVSLTMRPSGPEPRPDASLSQGFCVPELDVPILDSVEEDAGTDSQ